MFFSVEFTIMRYNKSNKYRFPEPLRYKQAIIYSWKPILINLLLPGAGYLLLKEKKRAVLIFIVIFSFCFLSYLELYYGAGNGPRGGVFVLQLTPFSWIHNLGAIATMGIGPIYALFVNSFSGAEAEPIRNLTQEYGSTYLIISGLLNWLCIFDIFDRATGRWVWRLSYDEQEQLYNDSLK